MSRDKVVALLGGMDAVAWEHVSIRLGLARGGPPAAQLERLNEALGGDVDRLMSMLERDDLIAMLRGWSYHRDGRRAHLLGLRDAGVELLRVAARTVFEEQWEPRQRDRSRLPGTTLELCWYDAGTAHRGEFDDDDGPADASASAEFLEDAVYTIIDPVRLEGRERTGITFEEGKPWVAAARYFTRARTEGRKLALIFADSLATGWLIGWTFVRSLEVTTGTICETGPIVRLRRGRHDSIIKASDGQPLADNYIRPYMPCKLPSFVPRTVTRLHRLMGEATEPPARPIVSSEEPPPPPREIAPAAQATVAPGSDPLMVFSWGYEGWGSHTRELVDAVDAVEQARGFAPPLFVDVRYRRQVRAAGFRERAFEELLGPERHVWMQGLGNRAIADSSLERITIHDPAQAKTLLDLVVTRAAHGQRVIFFCSCGSPLGRATCHRGEVASLLSGEAQRRGVPLTVQEWPGGSPLIATVEVDDEVMRRLAAVASSEDGKGMRLPVPDGLTIARGAALPHGSLLVCRSADDVMVAAVASAICTTRGWVFPVLGAWRGDDSAGLCAELGAQLEEMKLGAMGAPVALPARWRLEDLRSGAPATAEGLPESVAKVLVELTVEQPASPAEPIGELILACHVKRQNDQPQWVDGEGVWTRRDDAPVLVLAHGLTLDPAFVYFLDDEGDIRRLPREVDQTVVAAQPRSWLVKIDGDPDDVENMLVPGEVEALTMESTSEGASPGDRYFLANSSGALQIVGLAELVAIRVEDGEVTHDVRYLTLPLGVQPSQKELIHDPRLRDVLSRRDAADVINLSGDQAAALVEILARANPDVRLLAAWRGPRPEPVAASPEAIRARILGSPNYTPGRGIRTLSVKQPWAWAILHGGKNVENRSMATNVRGAIAIHASRSAPDPADLEALRREHGLNPPDQLPLGSVVGVADIAGCSDNSGSSWASPGAFHWVLADPAAFPRPVPATGAVGFWYWNPADRDL